MKSIYTISAMKHDGPEFSAVASFDPAHALFGGHFPGKPVVPGVLLAEIATHVACLLTGKELVVGEASVIKFIRMIDPQKNTSIMISGTILAENEKYRLDLNFYAGETVFAKMKGLRLYPLK